jgi:hypothetical protein
MATFELEHPLGRSIELIHGAVAAGMIETMPMPEALHVEYMDVFSTGDGVAALEVIDFEAETKTQMLIPIFPDLADTAWEIGSDDGPKKVYSRLFTRDLRDRKYPLTFGEEDIISEYIQFDIIAEGIIFSGKTQDDERKISFGEYESENYELFNRLARHQSGVQALLALATAY